MIHDEFPPHATKQFSSSSASSSSHLWKSSLSSGSHYVKVNIYVFKIDTHTVSAQSQLSQGHPLGQPSMHGQSLSPLS